MIPQRIVAIGTSAFFGTGDISGEGGYIGRLKRWHESQDNHNQLYNLGISGKAIGETVAELGERLLIEVPKRQPDLILLTTGINDIRRHGAKDALCITSQEKFTQTAADIFAKAKTLAKEVIVISTFPSQDKFDSEGNFLLAEDISHYAEITKKICEEKNIAYVDLFPEWLQGEYKNLLYKDGVHANTEGHEKIYKRLKEFLLEKYQ